MSQNTAANLATLILFIGLILVVVAIINLVGWWGIAELVGIVLVVVGLAWLSATTRDDARPR